MKRFEYSFDIFLIIALIASLVIKILGILPADISYYLGLAVTIIGVIPVVISTIRALQQRKITVDLLASLALVLSIINNEINSSIFINLMLTTARLIDSYTDRKTEDSIKSLLKLKPKTATVKIGAETQELPIEAIKKGDIVVVNLGERIPVDGRIVAGEASIDQSTLTGESVPVDKKIKDEVFSSTLIVSGSIEMLAERVGNDTSLEKIIKLINESQRSKTNITTAADRFAQWYIVIVFITAAILYLATRNLDFVLSIVLVVCADDIAIAIPLAFVGGIRSASRFGVIIKGGKYLEAFSDIKTLVVDKTGTLTIGKLSVSDIYYPNPESEQEVLKILDAVMQSSNHPISKAINNYTNEKGYNEDRAEEINEIKGQGVKAIYKNTNYFVGKKDFILKQNIELSVEIKTKITQFESEGYNATIIADGKTILAVLGLSDQLKPNIRQTLDILKKKGVERIIMLTGDNDVIARKIASKAGITEFYSNLLPEDKIKYIKKFRSQKSKLAMVGDGVNDAAALKLADIGISMGALGSDAAVDSSDIILVDDNLEKIAETINLSRFVLNVSKENYISWVVVNAIGLVLVFASVLNPASAAFFNFITDFIPLGNTFRTFLYKPKLSKSKNQ